jgi:hypothetical protein
VRLALKNTAPHNPQAKTATIRPQNDNPNPTPIRHKPPPNSAMRSARPLRRIPPRFSSTSDPEIVPSANSMLTTPSCAMSPW